MPVPESFGKYEGKEKKFSSKEEWFLILKKQDEVKQILDSSFQELSSLKGEVAHSQKVATVPYPLENTFEKQYFESVSSVQSVKQSQQTSKDKKPDEQWFFDGIKDGAVRIFEKWVAAVKDVATSLWENLKNAYHLAKEMVSFEKVPEKISGTIAQMLQYGQTLIGAKYSYWAQGKQWAFDCSWLVSSLFNKVWLLKGRETSSSFYKQAQQIRQSQVRAGDFMFWWNNGWGHIEFVVGTPYKVKNRSWKECWYVDTLGSSSDRGFLTADGKNRAESGVWYRKRQIQPRHQFRRPAYYDKLKA